MKNSEPRRAIPLFVFLILMTRLTRPYCTPHFVKCLASVAKENQPELAKKNVKRTAREWRRLGAALDPVDCWSMPARHIKHIRVSVQTNDTTRRSGPHKGVKGYGTGSAGNTQRGAVRFDFDALA